MCGVLLGVLIDVVSEMFFFGMLIGGCLEIGWFLFDSYSGCLGSFLILVKIFVIWLWLRVFFLSSVRVSLLRMLWFLLIMV